MHTLTERKDTKEKERIRYPPNVINEKQMIERI